MNNLSFKTAGAHGQSRLLLTSGSSQRFSGVQNLPIRKSDGLKRLLVFCI